MSRRIVDITRPLDAALPVWPGDPPVAVRRLASFEDGGDVMVSAVDMSAHGGTHVDAPAHYVAGAATVDELRLSDLVGPAEVVDAPADGPIDAAFLAGLHLPAGTRRVLLRTGHDWSAGILPERLPGLSPDGARWLVGAGTRLVGIDTPSIAAHDRIAETHVILMAAGVVVVESLDLSGAPQGSYELVCLPLPLVGAEAAPARALLIADPPSPEVRG